MSDPLWKCLTCHRVATGFYADGQCWESGCVERPQSVLMPRAKLKPSRGTHQPPLRSTRDA